MTLQKVGDEPKTVDVLVNGSQEASYTQSQNRADYDVDISTSGTSAYDGYTVKVRESAYTPDGTYDVLTFSGPASKTADDGGDWRVRFGVNMTSNADSEDFTLIVDGNSGPSVTGVGSSDGMVWSGWHYGNWTQLQIRKDTGGADYPSWWLQMEHASQDANTTYSVDGVTQS